MTLSHCGLRPSRYLGVQQFPDAAPVHLYECAACTTTFTGPDPLDTIKALNLACVFLSHNVDAKSLDFILEMNREDDALPYNQLFADALSAARERHRAAVLAEALQRANDK